MPIKKVLQNHCLHLSALTAEFIAKPFGLQVNNVTLILEEEWFSHQSKVASFFY